VGELWWAGLLAFWPLAIHFCDALYPSSVLRLIPNVFFTLKFLDCFLDISFKYFVANVFISQASTQTMYIKSIIQNNNATISIKILCLGEIRTRVC
jgi:hypothetical protein